MRRRFAAPRPLVFAAWTRPQLLRRWLGVRDGWTMSHCEVELRIGGSYRYVWQHADGREIGMGGDYREVVAPERIVNTEVFDEPWFEGDALITHALEEAEGDTICTITMRYESGAARAGVLASPMERGLRESFATLDTLLPTLR